MYLYSVHGLRALLGSNSLIIGPPTWIYCNILHTSDAWKKDKHSDESIQKSSSRKWHVMSDNPAGIILSVLCWEIFTSYGWMHNGNTCPSAMCAGKAPDEKHPWLERTVCWKGQEVSSMLITCWNEASLAFPDLVLKSNFLDHLFNSLFS